MQISIQLPQAFSVRDENEFYAFRHLLGRMNPDLRVVQLTTGMHLHGSCTVFWGVVLSVAQKPTWPEVEVALLQAGFDFRRNGQQVEAAWAALEQAK